MSLYVVIGYDTPSDRRRARLARLLKGYGERRQFSLFEARLSRTQWAALKAQLLRAIDPAEDNLAVYFLPPDAVERTLRVGNAAVKPLEEPDIL